MKTDEIKGIIFDLDGTLVDTAVDLCGSINYGRNHFVLKPLDPEEIISYVGSGIDFLVSSSFKDSGIPLAAAKAVVTRHYEQHAVDHASLYPGVAETLALLPQKKAIITNKPSLFVPSMLKRFGIDAYFQTVVCGDTFPEKKPHPSVGFFVAREFNLNAGEIAVVGDHHTDLALAENCGMKSIFCEYGLGKKGRYQPDFSITAFRELITL